MFIHIRHLLFHTRIFPGAALCILRSAISNDSSWACHYKIKPEYLQYYLNQFCYKFNRALGENQFERLLIAAVTYAPDFNQEFTIELLRIIIIYYFIESPSMATPKSRGNQLHLTRIAASNACQFMMLISKSNHEDNAPHRSPSASLQGTTSAMQTFDIAFGC